MRKFFFLFFYLLSFFVIQFVSAQSPEVLTIRKYGNKNVANHDNNQHAENENIRIGNLFDGIFP